jgi:DDE family transposase
MLRNRVDREWQLLRKQLPTGWQEAAREARAIRMERGPLADPERLLRVVLGRAASNGSYRGVAAHARGSGLCAVSDVALFKRERQCGDWLEWIANRILGETIAELPDSPLRLRLTDATCASKPGSTGTDFRLHVHMELPGRRFTRVELTDARGGESFKRFAIVPGDLMVGDRAYGTREGVAHVTLRGGYVLVRINGSSLPMWAPDGSRVDPLMLARALGPGQSCEVPVEIRPPKGGPIMGRLCLLHLPPEQARKAQQAVHRKKSKRRKRPGRRAVESAKYVFVFTTVSAHQMSTGQAFATYRLRWQVELAFKTLKTVLRYGDLPNRLPDTGRTWLLAKLVCALLLDRLAHPRGAFPPSASRAAA